MMIAARRNGEEHFRRLQDRVPPGRARGRRASRNRLYAAVPPLRPLPRARARARQTPSAARHAAHAR